MTRHFAVAVFAFAVLIAACGGNASSSDGVATLESSDSATTTSDGASNADTGTVDQEQAMLDFAACMRENGVDIEDPTVDSDGNVRFGGFRGAAEPGDVDRDALRAAMESCSENIEGLALGRGGGDFDPTELQDTMLEYASCMRDNGYDMPDPDFTSFGPGSADGDGEVRGGPFGAIDPEDPDFVAAQEACQDILSGFGPGPGGGAGGGLARLNPPSTDNG
jgi:hypothetical protein